MKLKFTDNLGYNLWSHPTWVRGLKLIEELSECNVYVAPYVGAWIETKGRR